MANNVNVNYEDERFGKVESDKHQALTELEQTYDGMIRDSDRFYQAQIDASKQWADEQSKIQQEQTDFTIEKIEQEKDQANKDYLKEQSGAYVDWKKQSNQYGAEAEKQASAGLAGTGYSESSQVSMYNTYQNRVATARETFNRALMNFTNAIKDARLQNNAALAEIALTAFKEQAQYALEGFQYKNNLIIEQTNKKLEVDQIYHERYQGVLAQINHENAQAEQIRQFNMQYNESVRQFNQEYELKQKEYQEGIRQFNEEIARLKAKDAKEYEMEIKNFELSKKKLQQEQKQWEDEMAYKKSQLAEEKRQFNEQMSAKKTSSSGSSTKKATVTKDNSTPKTSKSTTSSTKSTAPSYADAYSYISAMITAGKSKNQVLSEISAAQKAGALRVDEANKLKQIFAPIGHQYT